MTHENNPVYHALMRRRSEIAGTVRHLENKAAVCRGELKHIDATLGIMGYDVPNLKFRVKSTGTAGLFHRGEFPRLILKSLREAESALQVTQIAEFIAKEKEWDLQDKRFISALSDKTGKVMARMRKRYHLKSEVVEGIWIWSLER
jgi:hypothetical protein